MKKENLRSPINGSLLKDIGDGIYYSESDGLMYIVNNNGDIVPLKSPINGSPLQLNKNGLYYSESDDLLYTVSKKGEIIPLKSPINGSQLQPNGNGLYYSESDELLYTLDKNNRIIPLKSPINGSPLLPVGDGTYYSEYDDLTYRIDENGKITKVERENKVSLDDIDSVTQDTTISKINEETVSTKKEIKSRENKKDYLEKSEEFMEEQKEEKKVNIGRIKKIEDILDNGRLIQIYPLLPTREAKKEFIDAYMEAYGDRLYEKLNDRIDSEFENTHIQTLQGRLKENKRNQRSIVDIIRSRRREPLRQGASERISSLVKILRGGGYITKEDREFLVNHLAKRGIFGVITPSEAREDIRDVLDKYVDARNMELDNDAQELLTEQRIEKQRIFSNHKEELYSRLSKLKQQLLASYNINGYANKKRYIDEIHNRGGALSHEVRDLSDEEVEKSLEQYRNQLKKEIEELEMLLQEEKKKYPSRPIQHSADNINIPENNAELQQLLELLERESLDYEKQGIKLPDTGISKDDNYEIEIEDIEESTDSVRLPQVQQETKEMAMTKEKSENDLQEEK